MTRPDPVAVAARAPYAFVGTVQGRDRSRSGEPTAPVVVRVEQTIVAPGVVEDLDGRDVLLRPAGPAPARGRRMLFLATSGEFGEELVVTELARAGLRGSVDRDLRRRLIRARLKAQEDALRERLRAADLVVYGRIDTVRARGAPGSAGGRARWQAAGMTVWRALSGRPPEEPVVLFPEPRTQRWSELPRFLPEQEGVWILRRAGTTTLGARGAVPDEPDAFVALDDLDVHAPSAVERIRLLLLDMQDV